MPTIGVDSQLILDGNGFWIEPGSYRVDRPHAANPHSAGGGHPQAGADFGIARKRWQFTVVAFQAIKDYAGNVVTSTGQAYRDQLDASMQKVNTTLSFTDPHGATFSVRMIELVEELADIRAQPDGQIQYFCHVTLVEATDLSITLDGNSYWVLPGTYRVERPNPRGDHSAGGGHPEAEPDFGIAKRTFHFDLLALPADLTSLQTSFARYNTTISFTDPTASVISVRFAELSVDLAEKRVDGTLMYYARISLREAQDTSLTLDGNTFWLLPGSYALLRPRVRTAQLNRAIAAGGAGVGERQVDFGPAKREWKWTTLSSGQGALSSFALLTASYEKVNTTLTFLDPAGVSNTVRFDDLTIELAEIRTDGTLEFYCHVQLREA